MTSGRTSQARVRNDVSKSSCMVSCRMTEAKTMEAAPEASAPDIAKMDNLMIVAEQSCWTED